MNTNIILSYLLIIGGIVVWALLVPGRKKVPEGLLESVAAFGGAFLLASCFINLVPHIYVEGFETPRLHVKVGAAVLAGFLIQLLLEYLTNGVEHGHNHCHCCEEEEEHHHEGHHHEGHCHENRIHPVAGLIVGLGIHAFLEGMPLVDGDGEIHRSLLYGIVLHNIPIALVLCTIFMNNRYGLGKSLLLLTLFAVMTPLGSLCNLYVVQGSPMVESLIMGVVVGILLHVSVSILFDKSHGAFKWWKLLLIVAAFTAAYFTPGCPEIYPL